MATTTNKLLSLPSPGGESGIWGPDLNNNTITPLDLMLGGAASIPLSSSNYTIGTNAAAEVQDLVVKLTGTLLASVTVSSANIGFYIVENNTTGNFAVLWQANFGSGGVGATLYIPQGSRVLIVSDAAVGARFVNPIGGAIPAGVINPFAGAVVPSGWLLCYGQAVNRVTNAALFATVGTYYGVGDGSTTFNVPDLRGRSIFGVDNMGGSAAGRLSGALAGNIATPTTLGSAGGEEDHTSTIAEMPSHNHGVNDPGHAHGYPTSSAGGGQFSWSFGTGNTAITGSTNNSTTGISIQNTGGGGAHNNMPPGMVLNWIIKT